MNCIRHRLTGKGGCQCAKVTQKYCNRKATYTRKTNNGTLIKLCNKCNNEFGDIVGNIV
jgi:hypothetical protein